MSAGFVPAIQGGAGQPLGENELGRLGGSRMYRGYVKSDRIVYTALYDEPYHSE